MYLIASSSEPFNCNSKGSTEEISDLGRDGRDDDKRSKTDLLGEVAVKPVKVGGNVSITGIFVAPFEAIKASSLTPPIVHQPGQVGGSCDNPAGILLGLSKDLLVAPPRKEDDDVVKINQTIKNVCDLARDAHNKKLKDEFDVIDNFSLQSSDSSFHKIYRPPSGGMFVCDSTVSHQGGSPLASFLGMVQPLTCPKCNTDGGFGEHTHVPTCQLFDHEMFEVRIDKERMTAGAKRQLRERER